MTQTVSVRLGRYTYVLLVALLLSACQFNKKADSFTITKERVETRTEPILSDVSHPRFSWTIESEERGIEQTHYQLMVSTSYDELAGDTANVWNSGRIKSGQSIQVPYDGPALQSMTTYFFKVKVWCKGKGYAVSGITAWNTGLLRESDWKAKWIGLDSITSDDRWEGGRLFLSARYFRRSLYLDEQPLDASLYIAGIGSYTVYLNGLQLGGYVLSSTSTDQTRQIMYNQYSLGTYLLPGENVFTVVLGNGPYGGSTMRDNNTDSLRFPKMLFQLELTKTDGTHLRLVSDTSWRVTTGGPIRENTLTSGEVYDATRNMPGMFKKGFNDASWLKARLTKAPGSTLGKARLLAQPIEEMTVVNSFKPVAILHQKNGSFILDMGQNLSGWLKFQTKGEAGRVVTLTYGEILNPDGTLDVGSLDQKPDVDRFVLSGIDRHEIFRPNFSYHNFRYVQVSNWPGEPNINLFSCEMVGDGLYSTGDIYTSNNDLNRLYNSAWWTVASSYKGFPLDGSVFDRNKPTLACRSNGAVGESFLFDNQRFYAKWMTDIQSAMNPLGQIPDAAPVENYTYSDNVLSAAAYFLVPRMLYHQFADLNVVKDHYPSMKKWMNYMEKRYLKNGLLQGVTSDDKGIPPLLIDTKTESNPDRLTDGNLIANAYYIKLLHVMQEFAGLLGKSADQQRFIDKELVMKKAFQGRFFNDDAYYYANNTVTSNVLPLAFEITPEEERKAVFKHICRVIEEKNDTHITTGEVGLAWLLQTLSAYGRTDLALLLATNRTYPSWGYMMERGATTFWESWNADKIKGNQVSVNHMALMGDVLSWCYENVAGIACAPDGPGFKKIVLRPAFIDGITSVKSSFRSLHGDIVSEWSREGIHLKWDILIPANTTAQLYIPAPQMQVYESGKPVSVAVGISFVKTEGDRSVFELKSGLYHIEVKQ